MVVSTHSRLKAAGAVLIFCFFFGSVSTHSRLKAAGSSPGAGKLADRCFNTQPPEGGWLLAFFVDSGKTGFNTQPPEGGWLSFYYGISPTLVSTHSRLKAAGSYIFFFKY